MAGLSKSFSCFDRIFNEAFSEKYYLSIRINPDGLFYSVYDPSESKYIGFESVILAGAAEIYNYITEHSLLKRKFQHKACIFPVSKYTLLPKHLIINGKEEDYFNFAHHKNQDEVIGSHNLMSDDITMIFALDIKWSHLINDHFEEAMKYPSPAAFIDTLIPKYRTARTSGLFIDIHEDHFDLLIMENGKLRYCNNFNYKSPEDLVYYTIFVIDQLGVDIEKTELKLSGSVNEKSAIFRLLRKYIRSVELINFEDEVRLSYALSDIPLYSYPELFNSRLCEL